MNSRGTKKKTEPTPQLERESVLQLIRDWKWFAFVPPEAHEWLAERVVIHRIDKGRMVYVAGDPANYVYGVLSGVFRIYMSTHRGDDITLEEVVKGSWFPHIIPRERPVYFGNCVCQSDAVVVTLSQTVMAEFSKRWESYYRGLYHEFADRAVVIMGRIELLSLHNLNVRLAVYLLRMARLRGQHQEDGSIWIAAPDSQSEVGARVGGTRQRVNGVFKQWAKKKIVELNKDGIHILDLAKLTIEAKRSGFDVSEYLSSWHGGWQGKR